ncbi:circadian clock protein KaiA, partial [Microcoleus sp. HI-ES]|nr:circadian clock protein KaiA [Microcoleus sp. HI-ES]
SSYRDIVLNYFSQDTAVNNQIDEFVNLAFFADVPVTQIVEIHMELMDEFAKQLKLEGRSEEILLDYRLTLIDAIAHMCEMYRRSIPKETSQGRM